MKVAFLNSWSRHPVDGSGTAVAISEHEQGLEALGFEVVSVLPATSSPGEIFGDLPTISAIEDFSETRLSSES